jgi:hypothetical protein
MSNHPCLEQALVGLWMARDGLLGFLEQHAASEPSGLPCDCLECEDAAGMLWTVRQAVSILESNLCLPEKLHRLRRLSFPDAEAVADLVLSQRGPQDPTEEGDCP